MAPSGMTVNGKMIDPSATAKGTPPYHNWKLRNLSKGLSEGESVTK